MRTHFYKVLTVAVFLMASCVLIYPHPAFAIPPLSDSYAKKIIEEGRGPKYIIPISNGSDKGKDMNLIKTLDKIGIITYSKSKKGAGDWLDISITEKGKRVSSGRNDKGVYGIKMVDINITKIVKNSEYKTPLANPDDELRMVMGVFNATPTQIGKEFFAAMGEAPNIEQRKFRALVKYDPFKEKYVYVTSDDGKIDKDNFDSDNVEKYNWPLGYKKY